jgi:aspartyl-tRNA(Asn)/glutamyl-tRNA(Gln) amidotransferase subunit C
MSDSSLNVRHLAHLARLTLSEDEISAFGAQLGQVLDYVKALEKIDVSGVEATAHASPVFNVLREDISRPGFSVDEALSNAPRKANDLFIVTKVVE